MPDISKERREELRKRTCIFTFDDGKSTTIAVDDLLALLDAADERDRLREQGAQLKADAEDFALEMKEVMTRYDD